MPKQQVRQHQHVKPLLPFPEILQHPPRIGPPHQPLHPFPPLPGTPPAPAPDRPPTPPPPPQSAAPLPHPPPLLSYPQPQPDHHPPAAAPTAGRALAPP